MRDDYDHSLKHHRRGVRVSERTLPMSDPGLCLGPAETYAKQETEREIAIRLAALETLDPSQRRPTPKPNILNRVDYIDL